MLGSHTVLLLLLKRIPGAEVDSSKGLRSRNRQNQAVSKIKHLGYGAKFLF